MSPPDVVLLAELEERHDPWADPEPLITTAPPKPYPLDALPELVRQAVTEVQGFTQAPVALVAGSALAAASLACQSLADVQRAEGLTGPVGVFLLTVAESGERKTTADNLFLDPIRDWERTQAELAEPALKEHAGDLTA